MEFGDRLLLTDSLVVRDHGVANLDRLQSGRRATKEQPQAASFGNDDKLVAGLMQLLIDLRNNLRAEAKGIEDKTNPVKKALFAQTDIIRTRLAELGVTLEDRAGGTTWRAGT